jgi:hypothetical protein
MKLIHNNKVFNQANFLNEDELEKAVAKNSSEIFGFKSIYIDIKKKVKHKKNSFISIPDGYVLDFRSVPQLWVIENELSSHDSFKHIGIQLLKFASQFSEGSFQIKEILLEAINSAPELTDKAKFLVSKSKLSNISEALDSAIFKNDFGFIIVIDEITEDLSRVTRELAKQPELIQIQKYSCNGEVCYVFDELLKELDEAKSTKVKEIEDIDTMVAPAKAGGHRKAFLKEKAWWAVRISSSVIPKLKYLAMYEVAPVSAISWVGKIQSIKLYEGTGKYKIFLSEISKLKKPIRMGDPRLAPQSPRYTKFKLFDKAKTLADIF